MSIKEISSEEVAKHNKVDDCWIVIGNEKTGMSECKLYSKKNEELLNLTPSNMFLKRWFKCI